MTYQQVTLKVCEGCGTLWIRKQTGFGVYCSPCADLLKDFPDPLTRRRAGRPKKRRNGDALIEGMMPALAGGAR